MFNNSDPINILKGLSMCLKKLNVHGLVAIETMPELIALLPRASKDANLSISSTHASPYHQNGYYKPKRAMNGHINSFQITSTHGECIMITTSTKIHKFDKSLFLRKSSANGSDAKETKRLLNDIPQSTACITTVPEIQQTTNVDNVLPKAVEVVESEKTYLPTTQDTWNKEDQLLIDWFKKHRNVFPTTHIKIKISPTHTFEARHPITWYNRLSEEIARGPHGTQAKHGFLQQDLRRLKEYVERFNQIGRR
jgi:hypothetical protein